MLISSLREEIKTGNTGIYIYLQSTHTYITLLVDLSEDAVKPVTFLQKQFKY